MLSPHLPQDIFTVSNYINMLIGFFWYTSMTETWESFLSQNSMCFSIFLCFYMKTDKFSVFHTMLAKFPKYCRISATPAPIANWNLHSIRQYVYKLWSSYIPNAILIIKVNQPQGWLHAVSLADTSFVLPRLPRISAPNRCLFQKLKKCATLKRDPHFHTITYHKQKWWQ